ncbi:MAG: nicotinate (nicotinamide) nucleotide adenylyltransferase [Dehalococcoidia bacterium]|nr:nicotinate (nicotinamide) nucleotide adenylyltransferase [Dehalococcoidia bacterium]
MTAARPRRTGILGGTFDPPHRAHLALAEAAHVALALERVLFIPAGDPWRKAGRAVSAAVDRLALVRAAVADLPWAEVSTIEVDRDGPTFTLDTVEALRAASPGDEWWFILGADALADLPRWREPVRLASLVRFAVARRGDEASAIVTADLRATVPGIEVRIDLVPMPLLDISATDIRARVRAGRSTASLLPDAVRAEIDARGMYRDT